MRKPLGYCILMVSCVAWGLLPVLPLLPWPAATLTVWGVGLFIFAEISWWLAILLLGREVLDWLKQCWQKIKKV